VTERLHEVAFTEEEVQAILGESGFKQIDFLASIQGLSTEAIRRRGVPITLKSGKTILVLHPLDVLESRLQNLLSLPEKRTVEPKPSSQSLPRTTGG
jgi:hypothetical protein